MKGDLVPVVQRTLADEAAVRLRAAIRSGSLPPDTRLVEREIAESLGMSRIPVREAIERLVEEGLVRKVPHRGTFVHTPSRKEIAEIASLRVVLERFAVERAMARWKPEHEARLRAIVQQMRQAKERKDCELISELDTQFHQTLWEIADHQLLREMASGLRSRISRFLTAAISVPMLEPDFEALLSIHVDTHDDLVQALADGDLSTALEAFSRHILDGESRIQAYED